MHKYAVFILIALQIFALQIGFILQAVFFHDTTAPAIIALMVLSIIFKMVRMVQNQNWKRILVFIQLNFLAVYILCLSQIFFYILLQNNIKSLNQLTYDSGYQNVSNLLIYSDVAFYGLLAVNCSLITHEETQNLMEFIAYTVILIFKLLMETIEIAKFLGIVDPRQRSFEERQIKTHEELIKDFALLFMSTKIAIIALIIDIIARIFEKNTNKKTRKNIVNNTLIEMETLRHSVQQ